MILAKLVFQTNNEVLKPTFRYFFPKQHLILTIYLLKGYF